MIRLALTGYGDAANEFKAVTRRLRRAAIVAVAGPDTVQAGDAARALDASTWAGAFDDLLAQSADAFDAVLIGPAGSGVTSLVERAAAAGKHVFVEMPLALSSEGADTAIDSCRSGGVRLMVGQAMRFLPSHQKVKDSLVSGHLGAPGLLRIHHWEPLGAGGWRLLHRDLEASGGTVMHRVVRDVDLACWLFETLPTEVYAVGRELNPGLDAHDYVQVHLGFPEGGMALIDYSMTLPRGPGYFSLSVIGSSGAAYADDHANMNLLYRGGDPLALDTGQGDSHLVAQVQEFVNAIEEDREPAISGADGRAAVMVADAAARSMETGRALRLEGVRYEPV